MKKWLSLFTVMMILLMLLPVSMADSPSYTITYVLNDGYNDRDNPTSYTAGQTVTLKPASRQGCGFRGWFTDADLTTRITAISGEGDVTVYAGWEVGGRTEITICPDAETVIYLTYRTPNDSAYFNKYGASITDPSVADAYLDRPTLSSRAIYISGSLAYYENYLILTLVGRSPGKSADFDLLYKGSPIFSYAITVDHNWSDWNIITEPTAAQSGLMQRSCLNCGQADEVEIPVTALFLPSSLTSIDQNAFENTGAEWVIIPPSVTGIGAEAFAGNSNLRYVLFRGTSEVSIADTAFASCPNVKICGGHGTSAESFANGHSIPFEPIS